MISTKHITTVLLFTLPFFSFGQEMNAGFQMLESGAFEDARSFFEEVLDTYPDNKTAKLCYGRAVGLAGKADQSIVVFNELLTVYPGDFEVGLNLAEAYLWSKTPEPAIPAYRELLVQDSSNYGANLGLANAYSMNQEYESAYTQINKTLILDPTNGQALTSLKYIVLGLADYKASQKQQYAEALALVQQNLNRNPEDQESLSLLANISIISGDFAKADATYQMMKDPVASLIGQAVALHLSESDKAALQKSAAALQAAIKTEESPKIVNAQKQYLTALLWNAKTNEAEALADSLLTATGNPEFIASQAQVAMYQADFLAGSRKYDEYLSHTPKSFGGNLGKADAMHALGLDTDAYALAMNTLNYYPAQKDVVRFINRLNADHSPTVLETFSYDQSSDGSVSKSWKTDLSLSLSPKLKTNYGYQKRQFSSMNTESNQTSETVSASASYQVNERLKMNASVAAVKIQTDQNVWNSDIDLTADIWLSKFQKITVGFQNEIQDFNGALLEQNLKTSHIVLKNNMFWKQYSIGWYSEVYRSAISDGNKRSLLFTSVYKTFNMKPEVKTGLNAMVMSFAESKPANYYSPDIYKQLEAFAGVKVGNTRWVTANLDLAAGMQFLTNEQQLTWRTKLTIARPIGRLNLEASAAYSTISAAMSNGFSHFQAQCKASLRLSDKPLFYKRLTQ